MVMITIGQDGFRMRSNCQIISKLLSTGCGHISDPSYSLQLLLSFLNP